jgi:plastocyanin
MSADPYCAGANQGDTSEAVLVVGEGGGLGEAFIYVKSAPSAGGAPPEQAVVIDQEKCRYRPRVVGVQVDQPLEFRNSDITLHNVHAVPELSKGFNIGMPTKGMTSTRKFSTPEVFVRIKCDVHPWMAAYVGVVAHPYYAVTGSDGAFRIANVPAGEQTVEAAHPTLGTKSQTVSVPADGEVTVDFTFSK